MVITTREQRLALKRRYDLYQPPLIFSYKQFRKTVCPTFGCDGAVTVPWAGMWLCIERDGYTHS